VQDIAALANLERLELSGFAFETDVFAGLMAALMPNGRLHGLQELRLSHGEIDSTQVEEIAQMLRVNTSIKELRIVDIPIGDEGARVLADALSSNTTVTNLNLCICGIGNVGAIALAGLLKKNTTIKAVNLAQNPADTDEGKQALLKASLWNTSLEVLYIDNGFGLTDQQCIVNGFLSATDQQRMSRTLEINRFRNMYLEQDHATLSPNLYPHIFAGVSTKPSVFLLFLQENREMFIPHLPDSALNEKNAALNADIEQLAWSNEQLVAKNEKIAALMEEIVALNQKNTTLNEDKTALTEKNAALNALREPTFQEQLPWSLTIAMAVLLLSFLLSSSKDRSPGG
jgi:hypothetical protein